MTTPVNGPQRWVMAQLDHLLGNPKRFIGAWSLVFLGLCVWVTIRSVRSAYELRLPIDLPIMVCSTFGAVLALYTGHSMLNPKAKADAIEKQADKNG